MLGHARRRFAEAVKALPKEKKVTASDTIAHQALTRIAAIYHLDNELSELPSGERKLRRQLTIKPLVEAYFAWLKNIRPKEVSSAKILTRQPTGRCKLPDPANYMNITK